MRFGLVEVAIAVLICVAGAVGTANAETITYIETTTATGNLGGQSFTDALVTLTATGDTLGTVTGDGIQSAEMSVPLELTVAGLGSTDFTDSIIVVFNDRTGADTAYGFGDAFPNFVEGHGVLFTMIPYSASTPYYGLETAIGPIDGVASYNPGVSFNTAAGGFEMTAAEDATFQAVLTPAATPEPGSLILLGTGVLGFAGMMRRRVA